MEEKRFTEEQIIQILKEVEEEGVETFEICLKHGISEYTLFQWMAAHGPQPDGKKSFKSFLADLVSD
ncbi:MAG: transposase, partial [Cyanobacteria bacterium]|nr:transposase [Cyanobacteriota bacterium]